MIKYALAAGILLAGVSTLTLSAEAKSRCAPGQILRVSKGVCVSKTEFQAFLSKQRVAKAHRKARVAARAKASAVEALNDVVVEPAPAAEIAYIPGTSLEGVPNSGVPVAAITAIEYEPPLALAASPQLLKRERLARAAARPKVEKVAKVEKRLAAPPQQAQVEETPESAPVPSLAEPRLVKAVKVPAPRVEQVTRATPAIVAPAPQQQTSSPFGALVPLTGM